MSARRLALITAIAGIPVGVLIGLVSGPASNQARWPGVLEILHSHPFPSLAILTVISAVLMYLVAKGSKKRTNLSKAADQLTEQVKSEWDAEARWRKVFDPYALPVKWVAAQPDLVASWPALQLLGASRSGVLPAGKASWAAGPAGLDGEADDLASVMERVPTGRLVVLGEKGAGKTVLLMRLILDLVPRRASGSPVPILLPLASWNPAEQDLRPWMIQWLKNERAGLAGRVKGGRRTSLAEALVDKGMILPILDGLDEIPERVRGSALAKINNWLTPNQGLILAARTDEYRAAVHPVPGRVVHLTGAAGIELQPLELGTVADYLNEAAGITSRPGPWDPVLASPQAAKAFTTPLMAALARVAYNPDPGDDPSLVPPRPAELLDAQRFPDVSTIEDRLFDQFIPASYRHRADKATAEGAQRRYKCKPEQAARWLAFLAQNQQYRQNGTTDIAWWNLPTAAPKRLAGAVLGVVAGLAFAFGYPFLGIGIGLLAGIAAGIAGRRWLRVKKENLGLGMAGGLAGGTLASLVSFLVIAPGSTYLFTRLVSGGLAVGIALSLMNRFLPALLASFTGQAVVAFYENDSIFRPVRLFIGPGYHLINALGAWLTALLFVEFVRRDMPARKIRWSPIWFASGLVCSFIVATVILVQVGTKDGIAIGVAGVVASAFIAWVAESDTTDVRSAASPATVLRRDRTAFAASFLGLGLGLGAVIGFEQSVTLDRIGQPLGAWYGAKIGLTTIIAVGLVFGVIQAMWGPFAVTRCYLAARRRLPWRLMTFLRDAHAHRGVLRQVGAVYQFRHVELQRRLAHTTATAEAGLAYCPFGLAARPEDLSMMSVSVPTRYGALMLRTTTVRSSETATLYIHGVGATWATWSPLIRAAAELKLPFEDQVFADLPGFGESDNQLGRLDIAEVGRALLDAVAALGYKDTRIVGHSMGGFLALDMASRYPGRVKSLHLVAGPYFSILDTIQHPVRALARHSVVAATFGLQYGISRTGRIGQIVLRLTYYAGIFRLLLVPFARYPLRLKGSVVRSLCVDQNPKGLIRTAANAAGYDADQQWGQIKCPITAVFGADDLLVTRHDMTRFLSCQPSANCTVVSRSGHLLHIEWPFDVVSALGI